MIVYGEVIRHKDFDNGYSAVVLSNKNRLIMAMVYGDYDIQEGDRIELDGEYRIRNGTTEFVSEMLKKR